MLATLLAGIAMGTNIAMDARPQKVAERDTRIIIEVDRSLETLTKEGIKNTQNAIYNNIKRYITSNVSFITSFNVLNNAFAISINSDYVDAVKSLPGVKSVTIDQIRFVTPMTQTVLGDGDSGEEYGGSENASAVTMNKPDDTNDGEGTVIAILDNEFFFRGRVDGKDQWKHETYTALDDSVNVKFKTRPDITETHVYNVHVDDRESQPYRWRDAIDAAELGEEGSLYFNNKVPFYFDYGGEREYYGGGYNEDFDVSSTITYHGSHVASIAAGNDPIYKGIAPKAQLVCMKVFTNFKASKIDTAMGFSSSSGAYDIPILHALEDCITLGVDGINMSLGSNLDDFDEDTITMRTIQRLSESGILSAISAGNAGKTSWSFAGAYGNWTREMVETGILSGYANAPSAMTIASGQPAKTFFASAFKLDGENIAYQDQITNREGADDYDEEHRIADLVKESATKELNWVYIPNFGSSTDYVGKNVDGKIAIVNRGNISFSDKYNVAKQKGAIGLVIINNDPTASDFNFRCSFGEEQPTIPVALVLFKNKEKFSLDEDGMGTFKVVENEVDVNPQQYTMSSFSTDGATFDLDLKPEITAPGDNIKGAVPPQKKEDRGEDRRYKVYEFLSGTSMSAPNYAGAQSVILSKKAAEVYAKENPSDAELAELAKFRSTVDMRLMSTANPMSDYEEAPEVNPNYPLEKDPLDDTRYKGYTTSPRLQGAGMADIGDAYNTDVYLEGYDLSGNLTGKSKIALRNSEQINSGTVSLSFMAHNESEENRTYHASFTVMRPAVKMSNEIVTKDYNYRGEIDTIDAFSGRSYWVTQVNPQGQTEIVERHATGNIAVNDVFKVSKEISYFKSYEDCLNNVETKIEIGRYVCTKVEEGLAPDGETKWSYGTFETYGSLPYQSTQDYMIKKVEISQNIVVAPGDHKVTLDSYSLTNEEKAAIKEAFEYGCYLEGYVTLESTDGHVDLSMPWMGFYGGEGQSYESAPVVEPFNFEKSTSKVYPSDLVNDIAYSLLGKSNVDFGSTWVTTYVEPGKAINRDQLQSNDESLSHLCEVDNNYHLLGTDTTGKYYDHPEDHLYVGNPNKSNTMILQQFVLRSVKDNYFTIKNSSGEVVYKNALEDFLFGDRYNTHELYKSHIDSSYLGSGYVAHRAFAVIPLYNPETGESFASGDYTIQFNYLLAGTGTWVNKSYVLHVDSEDPEITKISTNGDKVRFDIKEADLVSAVVGQNVFEFSKDSSGYYIELTKAQVLDELETNMNEVYGSGRLYIELVDRAYGRTGALIRFKENSDGTVDLSKYTIVEHYSFTLGNDFEDLGNSVSYVTYDPKKMVNKEYTVDSAVRVKRSSDSSGSVASNGCGGNVATSSILLASLAGALAILLAITKKRKALGGNK